MHFSPHLISSLDSVGQKLATPGVDKRTDMVWTLDPHNLVTGLQSRLRVGVPNGCVSI